MYLTINHVLFMVGIRVLVMDASSLQGHMTTPTSCLKAAALESERWKRADQGEGERLWSDTKNMGMICKGDIHQHKQLKPCLFICNRDIIEAMKRNMNYSHVC